MPAYTHNLTSSGEHVGDERGEGHPRPGRNIGEVHHPQLVRPIRGEAPIDKFRRARGCRIRPGSDELFTTTNTPQALLAHEPLDSATATVMPSRLSSRQILRTPQIPRPFLRSENTSVIFAISSASRNARADGARFLAA